MNKIYYDFSDRRFAEVTGAEKESLKKGDVFICQVANYNEWLNDWIFCVGIIKAKPVAVGKFHTIAWAVRFAETIVEGENNG